MQRLTCLRGLLVGLCISLGAPAHAADIAITYVERQIIRPPVLSNLQDYPEGLGRDGARLAQEDNQTSGKFLKQNYSLTEIIIAPEENFAEAMKAKLAETGGLILRPEGRYPGPCRHAEGSGCSDFQCLLPGCLPPERGMPGESPAFDPEPCHAQRCSCAIPDVEALG